MGGSVVTLRPHGECLRFPCPTGDFRMVRKITTSDKPPKQPAPADRPAKEVIGPVLDKWQWEEAQQRRKLLGRRAAAVVIGINKTGGLTPLQAAVSGARQV